MAAGLWAALAVAAAVASTSSSALLGEHVCHRKETYNVTMKVRSKEPVTLRTYEWCMKVPPRCSKYHTELREVDRTQTVTRDRLVEECCPGFQKDQDRCVPVEGPSSQPSPAPPTPDPEAVAAPVPASGAGSPYWQQLRLTDAPDTAGEPPPQFSAAAEVTAQQKGTPPASAFPKKDTRLAKKGAPDKTAGLEKEKPSPALEALPATEAPETQTSPPPSPPPLPPELDLPPPLDMPPVPAMSDHNQSLTAASDPPGPSRSGRRRVPPEYGHPVLHAELPAIHWEERAEPGAAAHAEGEEERADHEVLTSTPRSDPPPESVSKEAISKVAPKKKASDVKEVPAYARKTATPPPTGMPPAAGAEGAEAAAGGGGGGPEEGAWEPWGWQPKELEAARGGGEPVEHPVFNGRRKAAHAKRGRGEDLKSLPPGKDPGVGLLVMGDPPAVPVEAPPAQATPSSDATMPTWLPVAIGASALVVIVVVSVSAAMLARGRRRYVAGAAGGGPAAAGAGTMELRSISPHSGACGMAPDPMATAPTTTVAAPVFLSPVFVQPAGAAGAEAAGAEARPGGGGGGQGLLLAAVLSPSHALCSPRASSFIDSMQSATYDVPPPPQSTTGTLRRDAALSLGVGGLQLHHMCTTPPPAPPPQHYHQDLQHVYEELPACWQRPPPTCH